MGILLESVLECALTLPSWNLSPWGSSEFLTLRWSPASYTWLFPTLELPDMFLVMGIGIVLICVN